MQDLQIGTILLCPWRIRVWTHKGGGGGGGLGLDLASFRMAGLAVCTRVVVILGRGGRLSSTRKRERRESACKSKMSFT